jgi:hypothetical protein
VIGEVDHWWWLGFRAKVWRPSLVRAGLLGKIVEVGPRKVMAHWHDGEGRECSKQFPTAREGTEHLVKYAHGGLRFHDLRHSYATWLVSAGVPINDVSAGHCCVRGWSRGCHAWLMSAARCVVLSVVSSAFAGFRFPPGGDHLGGALVSALRTLSYRDVEELLAERGINVDHVSIFRWVQRFRLC